jgi:release factor glutamine methyltransferase
MPPPLRPGCGESWSARPPDVAARPAPGDATVPPSLTLDAARTRLTALLRGAGSDAAFEARILLEEATGLDRAALLREGRRRLGEPDAAALDGWLARRLGGEPLWRVLGTREFWGLPFTVTPDVLDPRPDTETVVEAALAATSGRHSEPLRILDLGVGSGAILGALLHALPYACGVGVDLSLAACRVAAGNMARLGLAERATVMNGRWADALGPDAAFDVVASNPPYIETDVIPTLDPAVRDHDPHLALDGGGDGLMAYRAVAAAMPRLLRPAGVAVLEVGIGQAVAVSRLMEEAGLGSCTLRRDLAGVDRVVVAAL